MSLLFIEARVRLVVFLEGNIMSLLFIEARVRLVVFLVLRRIHMFCFISSIRVSDKYLVTIGAMRGSLRGSIRFVPHHNIGGQRLK